MCITIVRKPCYHWRRQVDQVWDSLHCYATAGMTTFCGTVCLTGSSQSTTTEGSERWHLWSSFCCCSSLSALDTTLSDGLCTLKDSWSWWVVEERLINCVSLMMFFFKVTVGLLSHHNTILTSSHAPHTPSLWSLKLPHVPHLARPIS